MCREHDELRYSLRSLLAAFDPRSIRRIHLLTTDLPSHTLPSTLAMDHSTSEPLPLVGLVPTWLNKSTVASPRSPLQLVHHSSIFPSGNDSRDWINGSLPTFNSMAIESRFAFLDGLHEHVFYMNVRSSLGALSQDVADQQQHFYRTTASSWANFRLPTSHPLSSGPSFACSAI